MKKKISNSHTESPLIEKSMCAFECTDIKGDVRNKHLIQIVRSK